jgi:hypothetical protein
MREKEAIFPTNPPLHLNSPNADPNGCNIAVFYMY